MYAQYKMMNVRYRNRIQSILGFGDNREERKWRRAPERHFSQLLRGRVMDNYKPLYSGELQI